MIRFETPDGVFNFRTVGLLFRDGRVLVHRGLHDDFFAFPGGRVELFEDTAGAVVREFLEELGLAVLVERLLWVDENFFTHEGRRFHELGFYYLLRCDDLSGLPAGDVFFSSETGLDGPPQLEFRWASLDGIDSLTLYPIRVKERLRDLPRSIEHAVER